jgi:hypothetical protein
MDYTAEAMQKTLDIAQPNMHQIEDVHGITTIFSTKPIHQVIAKATELPDAVRVNTLTGLKDLILAKLEAKDFPADYLIHVESETRVVLKSRQCDAFGRRTELVIAEPVDFEHFRFGQWIDQEQFVIAVASRFADSPDKDYVLTLAATLLSEASQNTEDDGFTQRVTTRKGIQQKGIASVKPRVALAPYRIFPEVTQPVSEFVFRARCPEGASPQLMLVEADGGAWKLEAIRTIQTALDAFTTGIPVIA